MRENLAERRGGAVEDEAGDGQSTVAGAVAAKATFGAGCFWGVGAKFLQVEGVSAATAGYAGGHMPRPSYVWVCTGRTGHAEVVQLTFDSSQVSYETLLEVFWNCHDPTRLNRQGFDVGPQYRSVIFAHDDDQRLCAERSRAQLERSGRHRHPIVTEILPLDQFWIAEAEHQHYLQKAALKPPGKPGWRPFAKRPGFFAWLRRG